jgi:hypothetical protein
LPVANFRFAIDPANEARSLRERIKSAIGNQKWALASDSQPQSSSDLGSPETYLIFNATEF